MTVVDPLYAALAPLISRVRTDVTAIKKQDGTQAWTKEPLTPERFARHLNGGPARGVSQIAEGSSSTMVGLLDFDSHGGETKWPAMLAAARDVMQSIELLGGAPVAFRSSGGRGLHVYCLWEQGQDAYSVRQWLDTAVRSCGYKSGTRGVSAGEIEIFPKQNDVPEGGYGNQAVLPLAGASVPIVFEPMLDDWVPGERSDVLGMAWPMSAPVPVLARPVRVVKGLGEIVGHEELQSILDAIPNRGKDELGYDQWRDVVFIIHHETAGEGLEIAHAFSARAGKYDADFLDNRVWPFIRSDRENVKGIGSLKRMASAFGWHEPIPDGFEDCSAEDNAPPVAMIKWHEAPDLTTPTAVEATLTADMQLVAKLPPPPDARMPAVRRRGIPEAHYLTTDQANAQRLKNSFGSLVFVAAGKWHVWDGKRWVADESDVYRYACRLSDIVRGEKKSYNSKADTEEAAGNGAEATKLRAIAEALGKWALKCEMKGTIEAAVGLARKMLTVESDVLDRDPWALNCLNGVVDLRTGAVRRHDPADYITKLVPIAYDASAEAPLWESVLAKITLEHEAPAEKRLVARFLQRWFGYCLTGKTTEQCFVVHWGAEGSNGKSTVLDLMADTLGDYAGTAAPGLLTASKSERHPTEIAALFGRRMVTAHETSENVALREDFIKQATGGDKLTARYMREDFFEFSPTHKLQLLTNHKPTIKGQDGGIWRRVRLVPYLASFGEADAVERGERMFLVDKDMPQRLQAELPGILAWRVRGAVEWTQSGLAAPDAVRSASEAYKSEQDRIGQFVAECCEVGLAFEELLAGAGGMSATDGLYPEYARWCKEGGIFPLSKSRFADDVLRLVPQGRIETRNVPVGDGRRRVARIVRGIRLAVET